MRSAPRGPGPRKFLPGDQGLAQRAQQFRGGVSANEGELALFLLAKGFEHVIGDGLTPGWSADSYAELVVIAGSERLGHGLQPVMAMIAATGAEFDFPEVLVDLVVDDVEIGRRDSEVIGQGLDGPARNVHVCPGPCQNCLSGCQPAGGELGDLGVGLLVHA